MTEHIEFIRKISSLPMPKLKRLLESNRSKISFLSAESITSLEESHVKGVKPVVTSITVETFRILGIEFSIRRVFIRATDSELYYRVGWMLTQDVHKCLICCAKFGISSAKHHCRACGNIVCSKCSSDEGVVDLLPTLGPVRVCKQCYWGQDIVTAMVHAKSVAHDSSASLSALHSDDPDDDLFPYLEYGPITKEKATPQFVLKARQSKNHQVVYINVCSSNKVPYILPGSNPSHKDHSDSATITTSESESPIYMVGRMQTKKSSSGRNISKEFEQTFAVDVIVNPKQLHLSNDDDKVHLDNKELCEKIIKFVGNKIIRRLLSVYYGELAYGNYYDINVAMSLQSRSSFTAPPKVSTIDFVLPAPEAFLKMHHVVTQLSHLTQRAIDISVPTPETISVNYSSSSDDVTSPSYPYTPLNITTNTQSDRRKTSIIQQPPKPVFMRLTRGFVLKTRRIINSADAITVKVFINVYSGHMTGLLTDSDSLQRTSSPDLEVFSLYLSPKMSNVSDRRGSPSLLLNVAFEDPDVEKYKDSTTSNKIVAALNDAFDDCLDSSKCIVLQLANKLKGSDHLLHEPAEMFRYQPAQKIQRIFVVGEPDDCDDVSTASRQPSMESRDVSSTASRRPSTLNNFLSFLSPTSDIHHLSERNPNNIQNYKDFNKRESSVAEGSVFGDDNASVCSSVAPSQSHGRRDSAFAAIFENRIQLSLQLEDYMFEPDSEVLDKREAQALLLKSTFFPDVLVGWKILLLQSDTKKQNLFVITSVRKNHLRQSEYELSCLTHCMWVKLKRSKNKHGEPFQLLRKVLLLDV